MSPFRSFVTFLVACTLSSISCSKPNSTDIPIDPVVPPVVIDSANFSVANEWQCLIDGVRYSGTIDTSFMHFIYQSGNDSVISCSGTSADKKAHIHFRFSMNRKKFPEGGVNNGVTINNNLVFDTAANNLLVSNVATVSTRTNYNIDTLIGSNVTGNFSGTLTDQSLVNHSVSGKFSFKLNTGTNEPNKYYCRIDSLLRQGYLTSTMLNANTLMLIGVDYMEDPVYQFRLFVRTGGVIKPGTYYSKNGDISFAVSGPFMDGPYYVDDTIGDLAVTILSVNGNIVHGIFSGKNEEKHTIGDGEFTCSVSNYLPEEDRDNRWYFGAYISPSFGYYNCYAGNIVNAIKSTNGDRYVLTINGESDNGQSRFKVAISSTEPIKQGSYWTEPTSQLDSLYFISTLSIWNGFIPWWSTSQQYNHSSSSTCNIDSIDAHHVWGTLSGELRTNLEINSNDAGPRIIHNGHFKATF